MGTTISWHLSTSNGSGITNTIHNLFFVVCRWVRWYFEVETRNGEILCGKGLWRLSEMWTKPMVSMVHEREGRAAELTFHTQRRIKGWEWQSISGRHDNYRKQALSPGDATDKMRLQMLHSEKSLSMPSSLRCKDISKTMGKCLINNSNVWRSKHCQK